MEPLALYKLRLTSASMKSFIDNMVIPNILGRLNNIKNYLNGHVGEYNKLNVIIVNKDIINANNPLGLLFEITDKEDPIYKHLMMGNKTKLPRLYNLCNFACKHRYSIVNLKIRKKYDCRVCPRCNWGLPCRCHHCETRCDVNLHSGSGHANYSTLDIQCYYCMLRNK